MTEQIKSVRTYIKKRTGTHAMLVLYRCLFFGSFFAAILAANTGWKSEAAWIGFLNENSFLSVISFERDTMDCFFYLLQQRLPGWLLLVIFSQTLAGWVYAGVFAGWQGFSCGFVFSSVLARYGIRGISVFSMMCFPQWLIYFLSIWCMYHLMLQYRSKRQSYSEVSRDSIVKKRTIYILLCILFSGIYIIGVFMESYVNPYFLNRIADFITKF